MFVANITDSTAHFLTSIPELKPVLKFLEKTNLFTIEQGKHHITTEILCNIQEYDTKPELKGRWESHKKYIDFQYIISGQEIIRTTNKNHLTLKKDESKIKDAFYYEKYSNSTSTLELHTNDFAVFFPEDAHEACLDLRTTTHVKKAVIKIPYSLLWQIL